MVGSGFCANMLVLFETPAGFAIFKVPGNAYFAATQVSFAQWQIFVFCGLFQLMDEKKLQKVDDLYRSFETPEDASKV